MKIIYPKEKLTIAFIHDSLDSSFHAVRDFHIVIHDLSDFFEMKDYYFKIDQLFNKEKWDEYLPVIHISLIDFLNDDDPNLPRYKNVIDSGIWNYYVPYHREKAEDFKPRLNAAVEEIKKNKDFKLYDSINAKEIVEFKSRILQQSYIYEEGGHRNLVAPFLFHSESKMKKSVEKELKKLPKNLSWRFLLIDDHATEESVKTEVKCIISKCKIVKAILRKNGFVCKCANAENKQGKLCPSEMCVANCVTQNGNCNQPTIYFDCVTEFKFDKGDKINLEVLEQTKYDLILMDYLLEKKSNGTRNYAHKILNEIKEHFSDNSNDKTEWQKIAGSNGTFHFFFISAFTNALNERMLAEGLDFHEAYWHISRGACPTTSPYLFLYYLLKTLNRQIEEMSDNKDKNIVTLLDLLNDIYNNQEKKTPREQAIRKYNSLLEMRSRYDKLKYDACIFYNYSNAEKEVVIEDTTEINRRKSKLVSSLFSDIIYYDNAFWEHTMHLVYLTAFGTVRQWSDMWEEYMLIKTKIKDNSLLANIEKYITSLK